MTSTTVMYPEKNVNFCTKSTHVNNHREKYTRY